MGRFNGRGSGLGVLYTMESGMRHEVREGEMWRFCRELLTLNPFFFLVWKDKQVPFHLCPWRPDIFSIIEELKQSFQSWGQDLDTGLKREMTWHSIHWDMRSLTLIFPSSKSSYSEAFLSSCRKWESFPRKNWTTPWKIYVITRILGMLPLKRIVYACGHLTVNPTCWPTQSLHKESSIQFVVPQSQVWTDNQGHQIFP